MTINILSPRGESAPRQVGHRPAAKAYVPPSLKVYGGVSQLTADGTSGNNEDNGNAIRATPVIRLYKGLHAISLKLFGNQLRRSIRRGLPRRVRRSRRLS